MIHNSFNTLEMSGRNNFKISFSTQYERKLFLYGMFIKVIVGSVFASEFLAEDFSQFLSIFFQNAQYNPYAHSSVISNEILFPYGAVVLYILYFLKIALYTIGLSDPMSSFFALRILILVSDILIYFLLRSLMQGINGSRLIWLYWLSPLTFFINYIYGHLDVIPIMFLLVSIYFLFSQKTVLSGCFLGMAICSKANVLLVLPVYLLFFIIRGYQKRQITAFAFSVLIVISTVSSQFILDSSYLEMVLFNEQQSKIFNLNVSLGVSALYLVLLAYIFLLVLAFKVSIANLNLFIIFVGFFFSVILALVPTSIGWYYWIIPFFAFFFSNENETNYSSFILIQGFCLLHFVLSPGSDLAEFIQLMFADQLEQVVLYEIIGDYGLDPDVVQNFVFTFMQASLIILCYQIYSFGIIKYRIERLTGQPFLLGIGGNSGVGKSALAAALRDLFSERNTKILCGDDSHKWERGHQEWARYTHLNPKANRLHSEIKTLSTLKAKSSVLRSSYDHNTGTFTESFLINPTRLLIFEGLHPFLLGNQRKLYDLRIFIEPEKNLALHWKVCRDLAKRRYTVQEVLANIKTRESDVEAFVATQKPFSDIIVTPMPKAAIETFGKLDTVIELSYKLVFPNAFDLEEITDMITDIDNLNVRHQYDDVEHQSLYIDENDFESVDTSKLLYALSDDLKYLEVDITKLPNGLWGVVVFIIAAIIIQESKGDRKNY